MPDKYQQAARDIADRKQALGTVKDLFSKGAITSSSDARKQYNSEMNSLSKDWKDIDSGKKAAPTQTPASPGQFKHGGKVKKTGKALVHKGERVLTKKQDRKYEDRKRA